MDKQRVVIERRSMDDIEWSTHSGLSNFTLTPFGIIAEFHEMELVTEFVPWSDVTLLRIFDTSHAGIYQPTVCPDCNGKGIVSDGLVLCATCDGYGSVKKEEENDG